MNITGDSWSSALLLAGTGAESEGARRTSEWIARMFEKGSAWREESLLIENWQWLGLGLLVLIGALVYAVVVFILGRAVRGYVDRRNIERLRERTSRFERPFGLSALAGVVLTLLPIIGLPNGMHRTVAVAFTVVLAAAGVWASLRFLDLVAAAWMLAAEHTATKFDDLLIPLLRKAGKTFVTIVGILVIAQNLNIEIAGLLGALGVGAVAVGLAAKDTFSNFFGSMTVLLDRPFQIGDWVVVGDVEGVVEEVGIRSTRIRTFPNSVVTLPNNVFNTVPVDNFGARFYRRFKARISIAYHTPPWKIDAFAEGIRELILLSPATRKTGNYVYLNTWEDSALGILLYMFFSVPDWAAELAARHEMMLAIHRLADRLGVEFAFPTRTLHMAASNAENRASPFDTGVGAAAKSPAPKPGAPRTAGGDDEDPLQPEEARRLGRETAARVMATVGGNQDSTAGAGLSGASSGGGLSGDSSGD